MTDLRKAAQMALNYLDAPSSKVWAAGTQYKIIQTLRAALAQPEPDGPTPSEQYAFERGFQRARQITREQWQGLTDEEVLQEADKRHARINNNIGNDLLLISFYRAIEAKLREKNT